MLGVFERERFESSEYDGIYTLESIRWLRLAIKRRLARTIRDNNAIVPFNRFICNGGGEINREHNRIHLSSHGMERCFE